MIIKDYNDKREGEEDKSYESSITKSFNAILNYIKYNRKTANKISVRSRGNNINLNPLIIKLLNAEKTVLKKDYVLDKLFNIFDEADNVRV